jgi:nucleotide-binding universal stress UspA family protein
MFETLIWATDGSEGADAALKEAMHLIELSGGRIVAVHCDQRLNGRAYAYPVFADEDELRIAIREKVAELRAEGIDIDVVIRRSHREAADVIAAVADELDADLIVCGTHGRSALTGALLGSVAHGLLHLAACPVLVVPERAWRKEKAREKAATA